MFPVNPLSQARGTPVPRVPSRPAKPAFGRKPKRTHSGQDAEVQQLAVAARAKNPWPEAGFAGREASCGCAGHGVKKGAQGETWLPPW